jgi:Signal transduction histidine kinase
MSQYHPILFFLQLGVLISLGLAGYCAYRLRRHGRSLIVLNVGLLAVSVAIYDGAAAMKMASLTLPAKLWWYKLEFLGSGAIPSVAVALTLVYLGQKRWLTRPVLGVLVGIPAVAVPLIIVNPGAVMITEPTLVETGGLQALEHGFPPLFVMVAVWGEGITLLAALLVGGSALFGKARRLPALLLSAALGLPYAALLLKTLQVYPPGGEGFNLAPVFETASLALVALAIARYRPFELLPMGRSQAFDVMDDGYVLVDATGTIADANEAARTLLGEERLASRAASAVVPELSGPGGAGDPAETDGRGGAANPIAVSVEGRTIQVRSSPIRDGEEAIGRVFILRDITTLKERERALAEQAGRLRELDEAKNRFFENISHEFLTPLTLIRGPVRHVHASLKSSGERPEDAKHLELVDRNVARLQRLVDQILGLARLESGAYELAARRVDPAAEIRRIARTFEPLADRNDLTLTLEADATPPDGANPLYADPEALEQIVTNLLSNAMKFTPVGGRVDVTVESQAEAVVIAVHDTGPGIPEGEQDIIFERFGQSSGQATGEQGGTGIGLALAQNLVSMHGGTIAVNSSEGDGTTFTTRLPRGKAHLSDDQLADGSSRKAPEERGLGPKVPGLSSESNGLGEAQPQEGTPQRSGPSNGRHENAKRVLIVDDNADVRRYVESVLAPSFEVLEAAGGEEGTAMAREHLPDVILADVMMPDLDGHEMTRRLKEDPETEAIPVIMLTAQASKENEVAGLKAGADDYVTKPFDADVLRQRIGGIITMQQRLRRRLRAGDDEVEAPTGGSSGAADRPEIEQEARRVVRSHLSDPSFGVSALADELGMSRSTLYRRFKEAAGRTPATLITEVRIEEAATLLRQDEGTVTQVAYAVGFERLSNFSDQFVEHEGVRPSTLIE